MKTVNTLLLSGLFLLNVNLRAASLGTAFTYQGRLAENGSPANGAYELRFALYDQDEAGSRVGRLLTNAPTTVADGLFCVSLDFKDPLDLRFDAFTGDARWLEIGVRTNRDRGDFITLSPRQPLTPTPYALFAGGAQADSITGVLPDARLSTNVARLDGNATFDGTLTANNELASLRLQVGLWCEAGPNLTTVAGGLANTNLGSWSFLGGGTTNTIQTNATRAFLGGGAGNTIQSNADHATLGGGLNNTTGADYATVPGGANNSALGDYSFAAGRRAKAQHAGAFVWADDTSADFASTAGKQFLIRANGGVGINTNNPQSALHVAGTVTASGFVGSGAGLTDLDAANLDAGTLADARLSANVVKLDASQTFTGRPAFNGGFSGSSSPFTVDSTNKISNLNADLLDGLDSSFLWKLGGNSGTTAGTHFLGTTDNEPLEFKVYGMRALRLEFGQGNEGSPNIVSGSPANLVASGVVGATIAGGGATNYFSLPHPNVIRSDFGVISGGSSNVIGAGANFSAIAGGSRNEVGTNSSGSTIGGGTGNTLGAGSPRSVIAGGEWNSLYSDHGIIGGGSNNGIETESAYAAIAGGDQNGIGTRSDHSTIGGGRYNFIRDDASYATIPGGLANAAASHAFAAGSHAKATHVGSFVWSDSSATDFGSTADDQVSFRCNGGVRFTSGGLGVDQTVRWSPGSASWSFTSDRAAKEGFTPVDGRQALDKVAGLPITEWNYRGYAQRHIGPMAQDFHTAFPLNESDTTLNDADLHGVALAAIQGLNQKVEEQRAELKAKDVRIAALEAQAAKVQALEQAVAELKAALQHPAK
ncbi:MAG: tail fiber domain-containing protein [Verrucomicrobia bacterium]|nr:tail fiber domain-containing protein [Verrucomicrobiota bacterium]